MAPQTWITSGTAGRVTSITGTLARIGRNGGRRPASSGSPRSRRSRCCALCRLPPWYQETGNALVNNGGTLARIDDTKSAFGVYSFVEAAIFVVVVGVLVLLVWAARSARPSTCPAATAR